MAKINYRKVNSSNIDSEAYNPTEKELYIRFNSGKEYIYFDIKAKEYASLFGEEVSFGKQLRVVVKDKKYKIVE